jgi:hypothetical protein
VTVLIILLLLVSLALWPLVLALNLSLTSSDAAGNAIANAYAVIATVLLWSALGVAALLSCGLGSIAGWSALPALLLLPGSALAALAVTHLLSKREAVRWMLAIQAIIPPLLLLYLAAALLPKVRPVSALPAVTIGLWGLIAGLSLLPWRQRLALPQVQQQRLAAKQEAARLRLAHFQQLTNASPVRDWMHFLDSETSLHDAAVRGIRDLPRKQAQITAMLRDGEDLGFAWLWELELAPDPDLFDALRQFLRQLAERLRPGPGRTRYRDIEIKLASYENTLRHFARLGCPMLAELALLETIINAYPDAERGALMQYAITGMRQELLA